MLTTSLEGSGSPTQSFLVFFLTKSSSGLLTAQRGPSSPSLVCAEDLGVQILWEISVTVALRVWKPLTAIDPEALTPLPFQNGKKRGLEPLM